MPLFFASGTLRKCHALSLILRGNCILVLARPGINLQRQIDCLGKTFGGDEALGQDNLRGATQLKRSIMINLIRPVAGKMSKLASWQNGKIICQYPWLISLLRICRFPHGSCLRRRVKRSASFPASFAKPILARDSRLAMTLFQEKKKRLHSVEVLLPMRRIRAQCMMRLTMKQYLRCVLMLVARGLLRTQAGHGT